MVTPHLEVPGKIPIYINFTTNGKTSQEDSWNNVTSHLAGTKIESLTDSGNKASGISLNITKGFAGVTETVHPKQIRCLTCPQMHLQQVIG